MGPQDYLETKMNTILVHSSHKIQLKTKTVAKKTFSPIPYTMVHCPYQRRMAVVQKLFLSPKCSQEDTG